jgi:hypothetical protein
MRLTMLAAVLVTGPGFAADVSGDWHIEASLGETPIAVNCRLIQSGDQLTGTCTPVMADPETSELSGTIDDSAIRWAYDVVFNGNPGHVAFDGTVDSDVSLSGTLNLSGTPVEFTATKQEHE